MAYVIYNGGKSSTWHDPDDGYVLQSGESFSDSPPAPVSPEADNFQGMLDRRKEEALTVASDATQPAQTRIDALLKLIQGA